MVVKNPDLYGEIGTYEMCACGSGEKYKFCCKDKPDVGDPFIEKNPTAYIKNSINNYPGRCLFKNSDCTGKAISSHTIQRSQLLKFICENDHVYKLDKNSKNEVVFNKTGNKIATTFKGFCSYHDTELFKKIETENYISSDEQHFLFSYRTYCNYYYKKEWDLKEFQNIFKKYPSHMKNPRAMYEYRLRKKI